MPYRYCSICVNFDLNIIANCCLILSKGKNVSTLKRKDAGCGSVRLAVLIRAGSGFDSAPSVFHFALAAAGVVTFACLRPLLPLTLAAAPAVFAGPPLFLPEDSTQGLYEPPVWTGHEERWMGTDPGKRQMGTDPGSRRVGLGVLAGAALLSWLANGFLGRVSTEVAAAFPGWPAVFEGKALPEESLTSLEQDFAVSFPGRIGRFRCGEKTVILRWTAGLFRMFRHGSWRRFSAARPVRGGLLPWLTVWMRRARSCNG